MFKNPYIRTIIASNALLNLGIWVRNFAILLYVTDLTNNDPVYVSLISVAEFMPIFLFAIIGGTFADRWRPKRTMISCDLLSAASIFIVLLALWYGSWQVLLLSTFFSAILSQFSQPSAMKIFKQHVAPEQLQGVMALFQSLMALFMVIGPVIGTFIYQHFGIFTSMSITGILFLISALVLTRIPQDEQSLEIDDQPTHFIQELKEGIRYVWNNRTLRTLGGTFTVIGLAVGLIQPLMVFVAIENLGQNKEFLQWPLMANGAAMLVGGGLIMGLPKSTAAIAAGGRTFGQHTDNLWCRMVTQYCADHGTTSFQRPILSLHSYRYQHNDDEKRRSCFYRPRRWCPFSPVLRDDGRRYEYRRNTQTRILPEHRIYRERRLVFGRSDAVVTIAS